MRISTNGQGAPHIQEALLRANMSIGGLRALTPLSDKAQVVIDRAVVEVGLERLVIAQDVIGAGLTYNLTDPLSITQVEWESIDKVGGAQRTMSPSARGENQTPDRKINRVPVYLTTDDFSVGIRTLRMSQRIGQPLDTTLVQQATRRVNEGIEDSFINGVPFSVGGYPTYGLLTAPNANVYTMTANWNTATGTQIMADVLNMTGILQGDKKFGPYRIYVGTNIGLALNADFKANGNDSIMARIAALNIGGGELGMPRVADQMPANTVVMVQLTSDVIDAVYGQAPTVIPWVSNDGFTFYWMVMAIIIPRVRSDYNGNSGVVIATP
jgi:hypothetical protein